MKRICAQPVYNDKGEIESFSASISGLGLEVGEEFTIEYPKEIEMPAETIDGLCSNKK